MIFHEKLNYLMDITRTTNSALALYTSLDASYISRLRRGDRKPAKNDSYIKKMSGYFSRHLLEDYQKKALKDILHKQLINFKDYDHVGQLIYDWLSNKSSHDTMVVEGFLEEISHIDLKYRPKSINQKLAIDSSYGLGDVSIHYGIEGKREAVISFLNMVINSGKKDTLLLFSDEDMDWLNENHAFTVKWAKLLTQVISKGNKIKIIHTVSRDLDEMMEALAKWMPLYMTGSIEPYYYPRKRDGIFKRTLFIAPETAAVISTSVGDMSDKAANFLLRDRQTVTSLINEFNSFFILCRPLMRIFAPKDRTGFLNMLDEFEHDPVDTVIKTDMVSLATMPDQTLKSILNRINHEKAPDILAYFTKRKNVFINNLRKNTITEIIHLPNIDMIKGNKVRVGFPGMLDIDDLFYEEQEYKCHLKSTIDFLNKYENYYVFLDNAIGNDGYILYVKEDLGAIVVKMGASSVIFVINESNMTAAFWDYMDSKINNLTKSKEKVIKELQLVIDKL